MAWQTLTILPLAARTTSGNQPVGEDRGDNVCLQVNITAVSGTTPTLDISVEWSMEGTIWTPAAVADNFAQFTTVTGLVKTFTTKGPFYRVVYTIGGTTPSFTFAVRSYETV
jgi:hypothetical protein